LSSRTIKTTLKVSGPNFRRKQAQKLLQGKQKRIRNKEHLLTVEETERMTEFLMKEEET
jgi:hypothetical protein